MGQETIDNLIKRKQKAKGRQEEYRSLFESAYEIALPQRNMYSQRTEGDAKMEKVFDSTGIATVNSFVNNMQATLTPPFSRWAEMKAGPAIPEEQHDQVNEILENITDTIFGVINASNFNTAIAEFYYDLSVGTGAMLVLPGDDEQPINFITVPQSEVALEESTFGKIGGIYREFKVQARLIKPTWPDATLSSNLSRLVSDKPTEEVKLLEVTYQDPETKVWYYEIIFEEDKSRMVERIFDENPWIIGRWSKIAGEIYGRGPLLQALPDIKMLNKGKELAIRAAQFSTFGVYTVADDGTFNPDTMNVVPGSFIPVARNGGPNGPSVAPLPPIGQPQLQELMFTDLIDNIKTLMLDRKLPELGGGVRTATEFVAREKDALVDIGSAFGRLMFEFVQPLFRRIVTILLEKGLVAVPENFAIDNFVVKMQILSPIAKRQSLEDIQNIVQAVQIIQAIDPTNNLTALSLKIEDVGTEVLEKLGVDAELIRSDVEKQQIQETQAEIQQQQQQQEAEASGQPATA